MRPLEFNSFSAGGASPVGKDDYGHNALVLPLNHNLYHYMNCIRLLLVVLFICTAHLSDAMVRHINVRNGLSSRQVYEIDDDPEGYMWIYTNSGLDRFDGHIMKHYPIEPEDAYSDHIQSATSMTTGPDGSLWIALKSGRVYRYNRNLDRFDRQISFSDTSIHIYNFIINADGTVVVCTNRGLYKWTPGGEIEKMVLDGKLVRSVAHDGQGGYYAGTDHGLYHVVERGSGYRAEFVEGTEGIHILSLALSSDKVYIGSFTQGVFVLSPDEKRVSPAFHLPPMPVNAMKNYGSDSLLIGVDGAGVYLINTSDNTLLYHYHDGDDDSVELSSNSVTDIHVDRDNGIWIGTSHNGLNYVAPLNQAIKTIRSKKGQHDTLVSDYVNVIFEDSEGDIWYGTDKGASRFSPSLNRWWHYLQRNDYLASEVLSFGEDSRGRILIGTYGEGLTIVDKTTGRETRLPTQTPGKADGLGTDYVFAGYGTPDGNIWIGGINGPLTRYNINDGSYRYYDEDCIATIVTDHSQPLFGGNKGVGRYNPDTDSFEWTQTFDSIRIKYPVRVLLPDTITDDLWIATQGDGLIRYNRQTGHATLFTTAHGLSSNTIYSLARDNSGCIWLCTETDLYRLNPTDNRPTRFTDLLGTDSGVFNAGGGMNSRSGIIMLGTAEGCVVFNPLDDINYTAGGNILFTDFRMHDRPVSPEEPDSPLLQNINITDRIELRHNQNDIDLEYVIINYASPQRIGVEYSLGGYEETAHTAGASGRIRYQNLPSGDYTLTVKAIDLYSGEPFGERHLAITVLRPFWLSPWAILAYILVGACLLIFVVTYIRRRRRERHIESQLRSYAAIAHDIRTPMSMIKAPLLNVELDSTLSENSRSNLRQARSGIDKTIGMLDELLGLRREIRGQRTLQVQPVSILRHLQVCVEDYSTVAFFKGISIECVVDSELESVMIDPEKFDHIVDNLLSNAIKYTASGTVTLSARPVGNRRWSLSVSDTGIGMSKEDARHVFKRRHRSREAAGCDSSGTGLGLLITRRLVSEHKGTISFKSEPGKGSTFTVELPLRFARRYHAPLADKPIEDHPEGAENIPTDISDARSTIFIIDDDKDMLSFLKDNLKDDYNVITTDNPNSALDEIKELNPDLVISDVMMPRLRGDELCHILKSNIDTSHIPVILLTGLAGRNDIVAGLEASADDYVIKPFDIVVLRARIRNIIKSRQELGRRVLAEDCTPAREEFTNELDRRFMTRTMEAINSNMANSEYSVNELCADLGMSRTSVYNKIKALSGQSPNEFMRIMRLNRAKDLLSTHNYNISEVAYMIGFSDPKYFSTCFKKQFGCSPSKI
ncbi:MAG: response regulator [Bacteroides sp.]|nr:response regulator [Bacteroides sp.]